MAILHNISNNSVLFSAVVVWLFWCAGYIPGIRKRKQWHTPHSVIILANLVLFTLLLLRIAGVA